MDWFEGLLKMGSALAIVLALVALAAAGGRRWLLPALAGGGAQQPIRLAGSLALGGRRNILVVEVGEQTLVVGASAQALVLLAHYPGRSVRRPAVEQEGAVSTAGVGLTRS